jgi:hypothetical protein
LLEAPTIELEEVKEQDIDAVVIVIGAELDP